MAYALALYPLETNASRFPRPCSSAFDGTSDVPRFLKTVASDIAASEPSDVLPDRYIEHVAHAVNMVACHDFTSSPAAIASAYLATRFELYFRILSGKLKNDGRWVSEEAKRTAGATIKND